MLFICGHYFRVLTLQTFFVGLIARTVWVVSCTLVIAGGFGGIMCVELFIVRVLFVVGLGRYWLFRVC